MFNHHRQDTSDSFTTQKPKASGVTVRATRTVHVPTHPSHPDVPLSPHAASPSESGKKNPSTTFYVRKEKQEYIRQNPVRRGLVQKPEDYRWLWLEQCGQDIPVQPR